jgi:hypothetical protein
LRRSRPPPEEVGERTRSLHCERSG